MIIKSQDAERKEKGPMKIQSYPINSNFSGTLIELDGKHKKIKCTEEDRVYFIIEGEGTFTLRDEESKVKKNDFQMWI